MNANSILEVIGKPLHSSSVSQHTYSRPFAVCFLILLSMTLAVSQSLPGVKDVTDRLQRRYDMIDDVSAKFEQTVKLGYANVEQTFKGSLVFKKPKRYRLESEHQTLITDGATVWAYTPANKQVVVDTYKERRNSVSPEEFLLNLPESYYTSVLGREQLPQGTALQLKLLPKDDRSFIKTVRLWVLESTWEVRKIQIVDQNETETTYAINAVRLNTNVKDSAFEFTPPAGSEVVDLR
ncbi:MAG: outer membrane lipoprotein carrier protein LolA [Ignavibacteria bacterium RIFCSPLOWO2_02_FULL_55_14]|nr:MAG: outer membrane lipoprotein carrier protein LolA [Ignavibacteria bacterium RIFCSPLOWO2_12_FULL_56_21]OGU74176.1 MAG: outer membrane lipoprotein carrier protein LolA [Ignavibacteria bacterium RIFCSPLOWO2_02_FULL_55_14]